MDPVPMMNDTSSSSFSNSPHPTNTPPFHLSEIWHFPPAGAVSSITHSSASLPLPFSPFPDFAPTRPDPITSDLVPPIPNPNKKKRNSLDHHHHNDDDDDESAKLTSTSNATAIANANAMCDGGGADGKRARTIGNNRNESGKGETETSSGKPAEQQQATPPEPPKPDYIHVRARRGQATDSHSLAERARREKISERMKILQDLVPGCNKVIGKALVLDEIINYIQSLQRQVEFLSMKLEAVNSRLTPGIEAFPPKDFDQPTFDTAGIPFASQATREYSRGSSPEWLHMQVGGGFERTT